MLRDERCEFGTALRRLRKSKNLTLRKLAEKSDVPFPNISAIERGRLGAGRIVAAKLASGLGLRGEHKDRFLALASYTNSRDRLAREHLAYPAMLANLLPGVLRRLQIKPDQIARCFWADSEILDHTTPDPAGTVQSSQLNPRLEECLQRIPGNTIVAVVVLKSGRHVVIRCEWQVF